MALQRVSVGPVALCCEDRGTGRPLVFVHGNAGTHTCWQPQLDFFAPRYRAVAPDLRGHGESDKPVGPYPMSAFVADLAALCDALGVERAVLAGHSMGGRVVMSFALAHPERVAGLVLVGTAATSFGKAEERIARVRELGIERELAEFIEFESSPDTPAELKRELLAEALKTPEHVRIELWKTVSAFDVSARLGEIAAPTLIIVGELDRGTPVAAAELLHERIRGAQLLVIPDVAHFTMLERAALVNEHIAVFLRDAVGW